MPAILVRSRAPFGAVVGSTEETMAESLASSQPPPAHVPDLRLVYDASAHVPAADARELRWYFRTGGTDVYTVSPFEAQMERMRLFARPKRCPKCRGEGFVPLSTKRWVKTTEAERAMHAFLGKVPRYLVNPRARGVSLNASGECRRCGGIGWIEAGRRAGKHAPLTVRTRCVRGSDRWGSVPLSSGGVTVGDAEVVRLVRVERRLTAVRAQDGLLFRALAAYHEPTGGKLRALWELVAAGKTLLRRNALSLPSLEFFAAEVTLQAQQPEGQRGGLLDAADVQAAQLLERAARAWNATATPDRSGGTR